MEGIAGAGVLLSLVVIVFLIILGICWFILPFAIVGTRPILREIREELRRANKLAERQMAANE